jgi:hypothetical protein
MTIRVMIYAKTLPTKFYSLRGIQYCKNNFNNITEHAAIKESSYAATQFYM